MKKLLVLLALAVMVAGCGCAKADTVVRRIKISHADPALIMKLLNGERATQPEYSTIDSLMGWLFGGR